MSTPQAHQVRVRFAPSPTGYLHVGGLRTALYNVLFARKQGGTFLLRIEDTDRNRFVPDAVEKLVDVLRIFFHIDEGVEKREGKLENFGPFGPYIQSERLPIYQEHAEMLVKNQKAYRCFCSSERLEKLREEQEARKEPTRYDGKCCNLHPDDVKRLMKEGVSSVIRLRIEEGNDITFTDHIRGTVSFSRRTLDDQILLKSDGFPTYHLANVVDDHLMEITHVIRGEEWLPSTPKHLLLYEAFGWSAPEFAHIPLLLNPDRSKLSKRQGDVSVEEYLEKGYLPEALMNFMALLGWNPGGGATKEIFSMEELEEVFDLSHVHKGGAIFDRKKLDWINAHYIKHLDATTFFERALPFLHEKAWFQDAHDSQKTPEFLKKVFSLEQERVTILSDIGERVRFLFFRPIIDVALLPWKKNSNEETQETLRILKEHLSSFEEKNWTRATLETSLLERAGERRGDFLWPFRVALTGEKQSPPPFEVAWVLGKEETLLRIEEAIVAISDSKKVL
ncbi:MAG: glutamate--tRNA ligase [Candidatus Moraniibacteriota bacterium]|nr:MAG: glutamate--tRNA ligase [Candidatus Moranbacteria bacterium]